MSWYRQEAAQKEIVYQNRNFPYPIQHWVQLYVNKCHSKLTIHDVVIIEIKPIFKLICCIMAKTYFTDEIVEINSNLQRDKKTIVAVIIGLMRVKGAF